VQMDNDRMLRLIHRLLPGSRFTRDSGVYEVESPLPAAVDLDRPTALLAH